MKKSMKKVRARKGKFTVSPKLKKKLLSLKKRGRQIKEEK